MNENIEIITLGDIKLKIRKPDSVGIAPVLLMLHGWTGDENSMWIFAEKISKNCLIIAPRAPYKIKNSNFEGYSWVEKPSGEWSSLEDFDPAIDQLESILESLSKQYQGNFASIDLAGFSQGAAMSYSFALANPSKVNKIAGLAGFLPKNAEKKVDQNPLSGKSIFMAHGTKDQIIKIDYAYYAKDMLQKLGAEITFCESNVGHRLDSNCHTAFANFISS